MISQSDHQELQEVNRLLAKASAALTNVFDFDAIAAALAQLAIPDLADWCAIHLNQPDGTIKQAAFTPAGMAEFKAPYDWLQSQLVYDETNGLRAVFRDGKAKLVKGLATNAQAFSGAIDSYMILPFFSDNHPLGSFTFVAAESGRHFDQNSLALAENLVSHFAIYFEKAMLYQESEKLNAGLERRVNERTLELRSAVAQLKQSESTIQTLFRISNKLNSTLDVDVILDELALEAIKIVDGESGFAGLRTTEGMRVWKYFKKGKAIPFEYTWPLDKGIPSWVMKNKVPYGTSDAANDPYMQHELPINLDVRSIICTPILDSSGEVLAYFDIRNKINAEGFTINDQEMLMAIAPVASIAIQNGLAYQQRLATVAELKESSHELQALAASIESAREEERTHISRELHDQLGQALTAMKFDLAWLARRLKREDDELAQKASAITVQMDAMIKTVRRISTELRSGMLDDIGLVDSIKWQAHDFAKRTGIACKVIAPDEEMDLDRNKSLAFFRIFQEALTNVSRHAKAKHVEVKLTATADLVSLQIRDDGIGIRRQDISGSHSLGLLGMSERAKRLGGKFEVHGVQGEGTTVIVTMPRGQPDEMRQVGEN